jgi:hypothetical protein
MSGLEYLILRKYRSNRSLGMEIARLISGFDSLTALLLLRMKDNNQMTGAIRDDLADIPYLQVLDMSKWASLS